jgi:hypothetical protein
MHIATGQPEDHQSLFPYDPALSPGVAPPTAIVAGQLSGPTVAARDTTGEYAAPLSALEAEVAAAQTAGMDARNSMLGAYAADITPIGAEYGDILVLPPSPLDPGVGSLGTTDPSGGFYDPPRQYGGEQGAPGYGGP